MNAHLVEVFEEPVEDGDEVDGGDLLAEYGAQLVDGGGQGAPDLPLHVAGERLVGVLEEGPVGAAECECDGGQREGAVPRDVAVDGLRARRVRHRDEVVDQQLRHDLLVGKPNGFIIRS